MLFVSTGCPIPLASSKDLGLDQTYFYPATSAGRDEDRVVIPVQLLSLALASARGYLAVLSGDFSGFDRQEASLKKQMADLQEQLDTTKNPDDREEFENALKGLQIQLEAIPIERKQGEKRAKKMASVLGFVGEKEINLNEELSAHRNALVVRIQVDQLAPYLEGVELGGIRLLKDTRTTPPKIFMAIDLNAQQASAYTVPDASKVPVQPAALRSPDSMIRLNQSLLESSMVVDSEKEDMNKHIHDFSMDRKDDGIHVTGKWQELLLPSIPFDALVDFVWISDNVFEIRVIRVKVAYINITPLTKVVLESAQNGLDKMFEGDLDFEYVPATRDRPRSIRVTVDMSAILPAFPKLALIGIRVKEKELVLKAGRPSAATQ